MPDYFEELKEFAMKASPIANAALVDDVNLKPVAPEDIRVEDSTYALDEIRKRVESTGRLSPAQVDELMDAFQWKDPDERWVPIKKAAPRLKRMEPMEPYERISPMVRILHGLAWVLCHRDPRGHPSCRTKRGEDSIW